MNSRIFTKFVVIFAVSALSLQSLHAQKLAVKTNLLSDATATINLGVEAALAPKWTFDLSGNYNAWDFPDYRKQKQWMVQPEARFWFCEAFNGHFIAAHLLGGEFNMDITGGNFYNTFKDTKISLALQGRADVLVRTGGKTISPLGVAKLNLWETEKYIFPEFECTQLVQSDDEVTAGYNATRDVLLPTSVATGVWTQDGSAKVSESEARPYAFIEDTGFDFAGTHTGLKPGKYNVRPIVKLGPYDIPAFPETEFEIESVKKLVSRIS